LSDNYQAPRTGVEIALVKIWEQALNIEPIGIRDHFTDDLGGDSIIAVRIIEPIQKKIGVTIQMTALFDAPTIAELASYLTKNYKNYVHLLMDYVEQLEPQKDNPSQQPLTDTQLQSFQQAIQTLFNTEHGATPMLANKLDSAVFILSPPRSGSTLLRIMLAGHPQLFSPQELNLLPFSSMKQRATQTGERLAFFMQEGVIQALMEAKNCDKQEATELLHQMEANDEPISKVYAEIQKYINGQILVDKSPLNASYPLVVEQIENLFESPKYIHLTRHPYGMIKSYAEERSDMLFPFELDLEAEQFAEANWLSSHQAIEQGLEDIPMRRQMHLTFEQLTASPETSMQQVCRFLNIDYHPSMINPYDNQEKRMVKSVNESGLMIGDRKFHQHKTIDPDIAHAWKAAYKSDFLRDDTLAIAALFGYQSIHDVAQELYK